jgi:hypothetical protein
MSGPVFTRPCFITSAPESHQSLSGASPDPHLTHQPVTSFSPDETEHEGALEAGALDLAAFQTG